MYPLQPLKDKLPQLKRTEFFKDFAQAALVRERPELAPLLAALIPLLPPRAYLTFDYGEQVFKKGTTSVKDLGWHVDGENNHYLILCLGDFRTEFLKTRCELTGSVRDKNQALRAQYTHQEADYEAAEGVPVVYDSQTIHRGRRATHAGKRIFLRICASDYLRPRNHKLI